MNNYKFFIFALTFLGLLISCQDKKSKRSALEDKATTVETEKIYYANGELEVITQAMDFQTADTLKSGWNRIIYKNQSPETHFILMDLYPEGKSIMNAEKEIIPPFEDGMRYINEGKMDSAMAAFGKLPAWFQDVKFIGGTGLISPGHTAVSTFKLIPGTYVMECYVKMANGEFHLSHGMVKGIVVLKDSTTLSPPSSDNLISLSSSEGIKMDTAEILSGKNVFKVKYEDQTIYEHFLGHDVNLVKLDSDADIEALIAWMNWSAPGGLQTPSPNGFTFLGGTNNMLAGEAGFFEVDLEPGNYVLISEVPEADKKGLFKKFTVK